MTTYGPNGAGTGTNTTGAGSAAWVNPGNVTANDASYAVVTMNDAAACFALDTPIDTPRGPVAIINVMIGDVVWDAWHLGVTVYDIIETEAAEYLVLEFSDGDRISCTFDHPFLCGDAWVVAGLLTEGAECSGATLTSKVLVRERIRVKNLRVDGSHTFIAGRRGVHNK